MSREDNTRRLRSPGDPLHTLDAYEQALRNVSALQQRAIEVVASFQRHNAELCADLLSEMDNCDPLDNLLPYVRQLKANVEKRRQQG